MEEEGEEGWEKYPEELGDIIGEEEVEDEVL